MRVGAPGQAELERVHAQGLLQHQAALEARAEVFARQHLGRVLDRHVKIAPVPLFVVGELVIGRQAGMRLAIALHLRRLVQALPLGAGLGIGAVQGRAFGKVVLQGEHHAAGEVAVVRNGQHAAAGLVLVVLHPGPEVARVRCCQAAARSCRARPVRPSPARRGRSRCGAGCCPPPARSTQTR